MNESKPPEPPKGKRDEIVRNELMQHLARALDECLPAQWGFFLMVFPLNDAEGRCNYCSNARREDVLKVMANFIRLNKESPGDWMKHSDKEV